MKNINLKFYLSVYTTFFLIPLNAQEDNFKKINYGVDKVEIVKENWIQGGHLTDPGFDNTLFKHKINGEKNNYPVEVTFNPDGYDTPEIRQIGLSLNTDQVVIHNGKKIISRTMQPRSIQDVEEILKIYYQYYGEPNSIVVPELSNTLKSLNAALGRSTESQERTYIWKEKNYTISFYVPEPERIDVNSSELYYDNAEIKYSSVDYDENLFAIKEEIRRGLTPSDIVEIWLKNPNWIQSAHPNTYNGIFDFHYDIDMARKIAPEEGRAVKAVKFDIVFLDSFKDEVARWKGINFQLPDPLDQYDYVYNNKGFSITYDSREKKALPLEIGRQVNASNSITIKADVTGILFTNGELLKD